MKPRNYLGHNLYLCTLDQNNNKIICLWFHKTSNYIAAFDLFIDNLYVIQKNYIWYSNSNIKSGHHQIGGWHTEDILNKELKYFMRHIFSPHICYPLKLFLPSHKLREPMVIQKIYIRYSRFDTLKWSSPNWRMTCRGRFK